MAKQLHKRFSTEEAKVSLPKYLDEKIKLVYILMILKTTRTRFFQLLRNYKKTLMGFSIQYRRKKKNRY